jgi:hypothetical protein
MLGAGGFSSKVRQVAATSLIGRDGTMSPQPTPSQPVHHDDTLVPDYLAHWVVKTARSKEMIAFGLSVRHSPESMRRRDQWVDAENLCGS